MLSLCSGQSPAPLLPLQGGFGFERLQAGMGSPTSSLTWVEMRLNTFPAGRWLEPSLAGEEQIHGDASTDVQGLYELCSAWIQKFDQKM